VRTPTAVLIGADEIRAEPAGPCARAGGERTPGGRVGAWARGLCRCGGESLSPEPGPG